MTTPALSGFTTYYGVQVSPIGEESDLVILGHHDDRRALAALNRFVRTVLGFRDFNDYCNEGNPDVPINPIKQTWAAQAHGTCGDHEPDDEPDCYVCAEIREQNATGGWYLMFGVDPNSAGAFPVTTWRG